MNINIIIICILLIILITYILYNNFQKNQSIIELYTPNLPFSSMSVPLILPKVLNIKKILILDLDETLIHSSLTSYGTYVTIKRPFVHIFLNYISQKFDIILFTAAAQEYADPIIDDLDPYNIIFKKRYYRNSCIYSSKNQTLIKDITIIGNDMKSIAIIDNTPMSYSMQPENGIPIISWYNDKNDNELLKLIPILNIISESKDVRSIISEYFL